MIDDSHASLFLMCGVGTVWRLTTLGFAPDGFTVPSDDVFYIYQCPVPRLGAESDPQFHPIATRAARLICTTPEFDALAQSVGLSSHHAAATNPLERAKLRAELDGLVAHLYGLTEEEFIHILGTFPLVGSAVKVDAHNAYRRVANGLVQ